MSLCLTEHLVLTRVSLGQSGQSRSRWSSLSTPGATGDDYVRYSTKGTVQYSSHLTVLARRLYHGV